MSSTNRGENGRHVSDYYVTPISDIKLFLDEMLICEPRILNGDILDPCAGGCGDILMSYPETLGQYGVVCKTIDVREDSRAEVIGDYLGMELDYKPNLIITNPPFIYAEEIIRKSLDDVANGGFVVMLLRLNFFGTIKRKPLFDEYMPKYSFIHHRRISFVGGKTDSIEYQHCVWQKGHNPEFTLTKVI